MSHEQSNMLCQVRKENCEHVEEMHVGKEEPKRFGAELLYDFEVVLTRV